MQNLPKPGIYKITCVPTQKVYIGQSVNLKRRICNHRASLKHNRHTNEHLQSAVNKYGIENFKFEVIEYPEDTTIENLTAREQYWIDFFDSMNREKGFNRKEAGNAGNPSEETRAKMSEVQMGIKRPRATPSKYRVYENPIRTITARENYSKAAWDKYRNPEFRQRWFEEHGKYPTIKAEVLNIDSKEVVTCWSTREIAQVIDVHMASILNWQKQYGDTFSKKNYQVTILEK